MQELFSHKVKDPCPTFIALRDGDSAEDQTLRDELNQRWHAYAPFAHADFTQHFAQDPDTAFWEMYLAGELIQMGKTLLPASQRATAAKQPALCIKEDNRHVWIDIVVPKFATGPETPPELRFENEGGSLEEAPLRRAQRRISSTMMTGHENISQFVEDGVIAQEDARVVAICGAYFGVHVPENEIPLLMSAVLPIVGESVHLDDETGEIIDEQTEPSYTAGKLSGQVSKKSTIDNAYPLISAAIWSKTGLRDLLHERPLLTFMHNPLAAVPITEGWGKWGHELVVMKRDLEWEVLDVLAPVAS